MTTFPGPFRPSMGLFALLASMACAISTAHAQSGANFYSGGKINVVIGLGSGGAYDVHARLLARHMGKHIEGNPVLVPGSRRAGHGELAL